MVQPLCHEYVMVSWIYHGTMDPPWYHKPVTEPWIRHGTINLSRFHGFILLPFFRVIPWTLSGTIDPSWTYHESIMVTWIHHSTDPWLYLGPIMDWYHESFMVSWIHHGFYKVPFIHHGPFTVSLYRESITEPPRYLRSITGPPRYCGFIMDPLRHLESRTLALIYHGTSTVPCVHQDPSQNLHCQLQLMARQKSTLFNPYRSNESKCHQSPFWS